MLEMMNTIHNLGFQKVRNVKQLKLNKTFEFELNLASLTWNWTIFIVTETNGTAV